MQLTTVQKRVQRLENAVAELSSPSKECVGQQDLSTLIEQLLALARETMRIETKAAARGDDDTALAAIREYCRLTELFARISGQLNESHSTNILNVNSISIEPDTAQRVIDIYLKRNNRTT